MRAKLIVLFAVLVMVVGLSGTEPVTASAAPTGGNICPVYPMGNPVGHCDPVLPYQPQLPDPCHCDFATTIGVSLDAGPTVLDRADADVGQGIELLGESAISTDPGVAAQYRAQAQAAFTDAGQAIGQWPVGTAQVGYIDPNTGAFVSWPSTWRVGVGNHLTAGLYLMQQGETDQAMAEFDEAYNSLVQGPTQG